jgi:hypothetical protein
MIGNAIGIALGSAPRWVWNSGMIVAGGIALVSLRACDVAHQRAIGASKQVAKQERAADANARKAEAVRRGVERLPAGSLSDKYVRD